MAKDQDWGASDPVADTSWGKDDKPAAQRDLPKDVTPSTAGAGRGKVNPPMAGAQDRARRIAEMDEVTDPTDPNYSPLTDNARAAIRTEATGGMDAKRSRTRGRVLDADIPPMTLGSAARDVAAGALQIGPTAVKGVGDVLRLASADHVGKGVTDFAESGNRAIQEVVGSERAGMQRQRFQQDMADPALNPADVIVGNPGALADQVLPTVGSMALPLAAAGAAGKVATGSRAAKLAAAIDPATVAARANAAREAAVVGSTVVQNAGDTYGTVRDEGGDQGQAYLAAAITAPASYLAGRLTGGGAEGALARAMAGRQTAAAVPKAMIKEGGQELGEQIGQSVGETVGTGAEFDANKIGKEMAVAGTLGAVVGGGVDLPNVRIKRLRDAGETAAADLLQRTQDRQAVDGEVAAMGEAAAHPKFQATYRKHRTEGLKPAEAAARAGMQTGFEELAAGAGLSEKAIAAAREKAAALPLDKVPGFLDRFVSALTSKGIGKALPPGSVETTIGAVRDDALTAAVERIYADTPALTMDAITALEQQQAAPEDTAPAAAGPAFETDNDPIVTPEADKVHQAATSPLNDLPEPTDAQKKAGNYRLGHETFAGMDVSVENPQGSVRRGVAADGTPWETPMKHHYGYFKGTLAADGDKLDVFVKPGTARDAAGPVFVIDQIDPGTGSFDEHKVILGAADQAEAEAMYRSNYDAGWQGLGAITRLPLPAFKAWAKSGALKEPLGEISQAQAGATAQAAAPAPVPAGDSAPAQVQPGTDGAAGADGPAVQPDGALSDTRTGHDNIPLSEGGKPFKHRKEADTARKKQQGMRVLTVKLESGKVGYVLAPQTPAQLAAFAKAAKRLRTPNTSGSGVPIPAHSFIAAEGGLRREDMTDSGFDKNVRIGNRTLFAAAGKGMTIEQATGKLVEAGYLPAGSLHTAAYDLIRRSTTSPQYTPDGWERLAQAETTTRFEDHLAAQQEVEDPLGPIADYSAEQLESSGYAAADAATKAEVQALLALADDRGIDTERIREDASRLTADKPEQAYYDAAKTALTAALEEGRGDRVAPAGEQGNGPAADASAATVERRGEGDVRSARPKPADTGQPAVTQTPADAGVSASGPTWELRTSGTLAIKGDQTAILEQLKAGGITKTMVMNGGIMVGKTQAAKAQAVMEGKPAEAPAAKPLSVGIAPGDTVPVTVKDGVIMLGKDEAIDFDSGEPITIAAGATDAEIKKALKDGGALSKRQKFFGGQAETGNPASEPPALTAPTKEDVLAQQERAADGEKAQAQRKKDEEAKAKADSEVGEFALTGSNRAADVAAAAGQEDIFGGKIDDIGEKIGGARKDTAQSSGSRAPAAAADEDTDPAWRRRFTAVENVADESDKHWILLDSKTGKPIRGDSWKPRRFATEQAAQDAVPLIAVAQKHRVREEGSGFSIWRNVTDRKTVKVVEQDFPTREDAMRYMAEHAAEIVETRTRFGEDVLVKPEKVVRQGPERRTGPVTPEQFISTFGFRGVEFGNWNNQAERQEVMNHAYDGLLDMAELLNIPPKAISLNGDIGLGFGSRGHGLTSARAHYERGYGVMNLTKMQGAGALAHEWFHALDHYLGRQDGKASSKKVVNERGDTVFAIKSRERDFASHGFLMHGSQVREELRTAFRDLMQSMFTKGEQYVEDTAKAEKFVGATRDALKKELDDIRAHLAKQLDVSYYKRNNKPATPEQLAEWDLLADKLVAGEGLATEYRRTGDASKPASARGAMTGRWSNDTLDAMSAIYKAVRGRAGMNAERSGALDRVRSDMNRYAERMKMLADAAAETTKTKKVPTSYAMDAKRIDQGATTDYWTTEHEMGARAFSAYVEDQLAKQDRTSDFLSYGSDNKFYRLFNIRPFPEGNERQAINAGFDRFFGIMKSEETEKGVRLYRRGEFDPKDPPMSTDQVKAEVTRITGKWKNGPKVHVVLSSSQLPAGSPENARGLYTPGNVWIVASRNRTRRQVAETLAHEAIAHWGLRNMLGRERWGKLMANVQLAIASGNKPMREIQALVRQHYVDENGAFNLPKDQEADEIIAHAVERALDENGEFKPGFGFMKSVWAQVAQFLRDLGITVKFTNAELQGMLVLAQKNMQVGERSSGRSLVMVAAAIDGEPMAARSDPYAAAPDGLMGFRKDKPNKPFAEQRYRHVEFVRVTWSNGESMLEAQRGLNQAHALERARRNWNDAQIEAVPREKAQAEDPALVAEVDAAMKQPDAFDSDSMAARGQESLFRPDAWAAPDATRTDKLVYELQDGRVDLKRIQQAIAKTGEIEEKFDARLAETLYPGRVARRSELFIEQEVKPLMLAIAREKATLDEVADYLIARHAQERNEQVAKVNPELPDGGAGRNSKGDLMTNDAAAAYLATIPADRVQVLQALAGRVDAITKGTRRLLVMEGLEQADTVAAWEGAYQNYVPLFKEESDHPHPQGMGFTVKGPASKRATGSTKQVTNVLAHVLMQREAAITRAEKNRVGLALYGLALSHPNPEFWTTIKPSMAPELIGQELQRMGVDPTVAEAGMRGIPTIRTVDPLTQKVVDRPNPIYKNLPGAITLKVGGEDRVLMINTTSERGLRMAEALKNLDGLTKLDLAGNIVGKTTRWLAAINTQYNPAFGFVNLVRDTLGGSINLGSTALRGQTLKVLGNVPAAIQGIARELSGGGQTSEWATLWKQFQDDGGRTGYRELFATADERAKAVEKELTAAAKAGKLTPGKVAYSVLDVLDVFNTTLENSVRLSAYKAGLDHGLSRPTAAKLGRELTVDFNRKGRMGREMGPLYAFFNASVQGSARTIEALKGPTGAKIIAGGLALGALQALLLAAMGYDDDEIPEFVKTRSLIIPLRNKDGEKRFVSIPYPLGLHVIPNTGRVITELSMNGGKDIGKRAGNAIGEIAGAFNPLGGGNIFTADGALKTIAPTVVDPIIEVTANRNFAGGKIERESPRGEADARPGYQRAKESTMRSVTGQAYIGISKAINSMLGGTPYQAGEVAGITMPSPSPEMIRYIAQTAGGGVLRELEKAIDSSYKAMHGEKVRMSGIPLAGRFYGEVDQDQVQQTRYYDKGMKLDKLQTTLKAAEQAGDGEALTRIIEQHPEAALIKAHDKVQRDLAKLNKLAVTTIGDPDSIKAIDEARVETMKSLNTVVKEMEDASGKVTLGQKLRGAVKRQDVATQ